MPHTKILGLTPNDLRDAMQTSPYYMDEIYHYIKSLKEEGYVVIPKGNSPDLVAEMLGIVKNIEIIPPKGKVPYLNQGHQTLYNLQNKNPLFIESMLRHPIVTDILTYFLNDEWYREVSPNYIMRAMIARSPGKGSAGLPLHIDSFIPYIGKYCYSMQVSFILEDQTEENGCFVCVPKSHLSGEYARQSVPAKSILSKTGDILLWDSRLHHGTTSNVSENTRWSVVATFTRWWLKQNYQITKTFPFKEKFSKEELAIMGYCSEVPLDEHERVDIKGGYDLLS